jgi:uncharacterized membrane protein
MDDQRHEIVEQASDGVSMMMGPTRANVQALHIMMIAGILTGGTTALIAVIFAHVNRSAAPDWLQTHYDAVIRTFWVGVLCMFLSFLLMFVLIGMFTMLATFLWWMIRSIQGVVMVSRNEPVGNPQSWGLLR